jgi:ribonuclease Z
MLDPWEEDIEVRRQHTGRRTRPSIDLTAFDVEACPQVVWEQGDVRVLSQRVHHEPVVPSVAYRVETPAGTVVISGDTRVCQEIEDFGRGADLLVHEALRAELIRQRAGYSAIMDYHADSIELGGLAARAGVPAVLLYHLIPGPLDTAGMAAYEDDLRRGGYKGEVVVGKDLTSYSKTV